MLFLPVDTANIELCAAESIDTSSPDRGTFHWPTTSSGNTASVVCPNGPSNAMATRICVNNTWGQPNIELCATVLTEDFMKIAKVNCYISYRLDYHSNTICR